MKEAQKEQAKKSAFPYWIKTTASILWRVAVIGAGLYMVGYFIDSGEQLTNGEIIFVIPGVLIFSYLLLSFWD